jgi:hypothetical protein
MTADLPTSDTAPGVRWVRSPRAFSASRTDGLVLVHRDGSWLLTGPEEVTLFDGGTSVEEMEEAIARADIAHPPAPWSYLDGSWHAGVWFVVFEDTSWSVYRVIEDVLRKASSQPFTSADRARRWAELRFDRGESGLRGPKPRKGTKARAKLPDVRVTQQERDHTLAMLDGMGVSYSVFVRAAAAWVEENMAGEAPSWRIDARLGKFVPVQSAS